MELLEVDKIVLFIIFIVPGFITMKTYNLVSPSSTTTSKDVIDAISYSCINYAIWLVPLIYLYKSKVQNESFFLYSVALFFIVFVSPIAIAVFWRKIREFNFFQKFAPHPTGKPWDEYFSKKKTCWVIVNMNDGKKIGGSYGINSFASSYPYEEQIYIDEEWIINEEGSFDRRVEQTNGIIIFLKNADSIEFYYSGDEQDD